MSPMELFMDERKKEFKKKKARARALKVIFELSLAVGVPYNKVEENIIKFGNEIKNFDRG